ncbi:hypothetical protein D8807_07935 [Streptococcus gordonii]|nr:hypothetical protein D8807_07935 [Streptococcus gordonii]VTS42235.1 Uncharacterised protein [Streptococcus gordonii]
MPISTTVSSSKKSKNKEESTAIAVLFEFVLEIRVITKFTVIFDIER